MHGCCACLATLCFANQAAAGFSFPPCRCFGGRGERVTCRHSGRGHGNNNLDCDTRVDFVLAKTLHSDRLLCAGFLVAEEREATAETVAEAVATTILNVTTGVAMTGPTGPVTTTSEPHQAWFHQAMATCNSRSSTMSMRTTMRAVLMRRISMHHKHMMHPMAFMAPP